MALPFEVQLLRLGHRHQGDEEMFLMFVFEFPHNALHDAVLHSSTCTVQHRELRASNFLETPSKETSWTCNCRQLPNLWNQRHLAYCFEAEAPKLTDKDP